jgi:hypothetical protein
MHETTQRRLCRSLFVAICIVPTLGLMAYAAWVRMPGYRQGWIDKLQDATGLRIALEDVQHPMPGATRLTNVAMRDPQLNQLIAHIREINIDRRGGLIQIEASQPQLQTEQLATLWRRIDERVLRGFPRESSVELVAGEITFVSPPGHSQTLTDVRIDLRHGDVSRMRAAYRVAGVSMQRSAEIRIDQLHSNDEARTKMSWQTGGAALPLAAWAGRFPALVHLGPRAEFRGEATIDLDANTWSANLSGELLHVDLDRLVSDQFPHKLSGEARIALERAEVRNGQMVWTIGRIDAGPGVIGGSLMEAARQHWQWSASAGTGQSENPSAALGRYTRLGAQFELNGKTLQLAGACPSAVQDTILIGQDDAHWQTPGENAYASISLIRVLAGSSDSQVPATTAARQLIRVLPLPDALKNVDPADPPRGHLHP